jgi:hypothetical protein
MPLAVTAAITMPSDLSHALWPPRIGSYSS